MCVNGRLVIDKIFTTVLLIVAGVVSAILVINAVFPVIARSSNSIISGATSLDDRIKTQITVAYAAGELDSDGWQAADGDGDNYFDVWVWVKNVGSGRINFVDQMDIFFGVTGNFTRIPYVDDAGGAYPSWTYSLENGSFWDPAVTVNVNIHYDSALAADTYLVKVVTAGGVYDEHYFSF